MNVRIRGIYTTALTELLRDEHDIVSASPPIRERFDEQFPAAVDDVTIRTTDDRLGVGLAGQRDAVSEIRGRLEAIARDTLAWDAVAPKGAIFAGEVSETLGSGAVVDLGSVDGESVSGFLPYNRVDGYVDEGDRYRVQIATPAPPWDDRRPSLATDLRIPGGLVELRRGGGGSTRETVMSAIADAGDDLGPIVAPRSGAWLWFGRESRFELDDHRRAVETTMTGHHRTKAAAEAASAAVDFVEALCDPTGEFPFEAVTDTFGPVAGDRSRSSGRWRVAAPTTPSASSESRATSRRRRSSRGGGGTRPSTKAPMANAAGPTSTSVHPWKSFRTRSDTSISTWMLSRGPTAKSGGSTTTNSTKPLRPDRCQNRSPPAPVGSPPRSRTRCRRSLFA